MKPLAIACVVGERIDLFDEEEKGERGSELGVRCDREGAVEGEDNRNELAKLFTSSRVVSK